MGFTSGVCCAEEFKIAIMQDKAGAAKKFKALLDYLSEKGIDTQFVAAKDYPAAAKMFANKDVDAMFSGSGIAGTMIIKELAYPVVRPLSKDDWSTYWAVVIAPKGSPEFAGAADYFKDKKVIFSSLASSGEFFFRSVSGSTDVGATMLKAASHGAAIDALSRGSADVAIVKNRVWDKEKSKYDGLEKVGADKGENPNGTLIASNTADSNIINKISDILLGIKADASEKAAAVKESLKIQGYIKTTKDDFNHTIPLLEKAGVTKDFNFAY
jgi:ABC-type phosphate/phosphonate transport system substrate-binding protein